MPDAPNDAMMRPQLLSSPKNEVLTSGDLAIA